jgi:L-ribulokinase
LTLGSLAPQIFKALVEATAFGSKAIVEQMRKEGVRIDNIIAIGGIPLKSPFVMQTLCDVLNMPIKVCRTEQACALGAAMFAATAAGFYERVEDARAAMNPGFDREYAPNAANAEKYAGLYKRTWKSAILPRISLRTLSIYWLYISSLRKKKAKSDVGFRDISQ